MIKAGSTCTSGRSSEKSPVMYVRAGSSAGMSASSSAARMNSSSAVMGSIGFASATTPPRCPASYRRSARWARSGVVVHHHAADVLPVAHVLVAGVDVVERISAGDQLVELELAFLVQAQQMGD